MSEEQKWLHDVMRWILQTFLSTVAKMKGYPVSRATACLVSKIGVITVACSLFSFLHCFKEWIDFSFSQILYFNFS